MRAAIRQSWDMELDRPDISAPDLVAENARYVQALDAPIPEYRTKLVTLADGQFEISVTPTNKESVINARMGFNPLLDCPRRDRTPEQQAERDEENRKRAAKRARQKVRYLVKNIHADHMLTFSYRENVEDRSRVASNWKEFVRLFRVRYPDWQYISVLEKQDRGAIHLHVAVQGKQDIRWLLRCWLLAIGQPVQDVSDWIVGGVKLGSKSMGAVNVEAPNKRWGDECQKWKANKLAGYLTKYIGKEFEEADKSAKKYWHSGNILKPIIERFWLKANDWQAAVIEAHDLIYYRGATDLSMWGSCKAGVVWICGETERELIGKTVQCVPDLDLLNDNSQFDAQ